jgi:hypothetical protein
MKGDFSRITFDQRSHFSRVLQQQGRVTLDADVNEQTSILLHFMQTLARDLFGPFGGPAGSSGFGLRLDTGVKPFQLTVGAGHYYVDGILCEAEEPCEYTQQLEYPLDTSEVADNSDPLAVWLRNPVAGQGFWVYLDVWERHISWIEDEQIREVALGGPDTCTRSKVIWQVKAIPWNIEAGAVPPCDAPLPTLVSIGDSMMAARIDPGLQIADPCILPPDAKYRGHENELYRVEIHTGGAVDSDPRPTFKWSRDNGSVATRWLATDGSDLVVANARGFTAGIWIELSDDWHDLHNVPGSLVKVATVEGDRLSIDPASIPDALATVPGDQLLNPKVRRWDQSDNDVTILVDGALPITEGTQEKDWIDLEQGIQIQFSDGGLYRSGDYWLIPARAATGSIELPNGEGTFTSPIGIEHHYAPLGFVIDKDSLHDCRTCAALTVGTCADTSDAVTKPARRRTQTTKRRVARGNLTPGLPQNGT